MKRFSRVLFIKPDFSFLVVKQRAEKGELWCFPGGKVEPGEQPILAACREISEELGMLCLPKRLKKLTKKKCKFGGEIWTGHFYYSWCAPLHHEIREPKKLKESTYMSLEQLEHCDAHQTALSRVVRENENELMEFVSQCYGGPLWAQASLNYSTQSEKVMSPPRTI